MRHSVPLLAFLFQNLALVLFFAVGGHGLVLGALIGSFEAFPVGEFPPTERWAPFLLSWSGQVLATGSQVETTLVADVSADVVADTRQRFQFLRDRR